MKSRIKLFGTTCLLFIFLTGCNLFKSYDTTTLDFASNGDITLFIVEWFDESIYDFDELCAMNQKEIDEYNNGESKVQVVKAEINKSILNLVIKYKSDDAYYDMNKKVLFYGDCESARKAGYNLSGKVISVADDFQLEQKSWENMSDNKVIIVSETIDVALPSKALYISDGIVMKGDRKASIVSDDLQYIICD